MRRIVVLVLFLFILFLPAPALAVSRSADTSAPYGVTIETKNGYWTDAAATDFNTVGVSWVRPQVYESRLETSPGVYNWSEMDNAVNVAVAHGIKVDYAMQHFASWDLDSTCSLPTAQAESNFASLLLQRYGSKISAIEVGNEEWTFTSQSCKDRADLYDPVLEAASKTIRGFGLGTLVGMYGFTGYQSMTPITNFFTAMLTDPTNPSGYLDYYNIHFYHEGEDPNVVASNGQPALMDILNQIRSIAVANGHGQKPIWVTEYGWNTNCNNSPGCVVVTPDVQSQYIQEVLQDMTANPTLFGKEFLYTMDAANSPKSITQNGSPLPAYYMMQSYIRSNP